MRFFARDDPTEELTQRTLRSAHPRPADQSELVLQLQRENLYLRNQLFGLVQKSGAYDMYLPCEPRLPLQSIKNGGSCTSPGHCGIEGELGSPRAQRPQIEFSPRRHCLSPRVQSFNNHSQLHQLSRARSPDLQADFCRRLVINSNDLVRRPYRPSNRLEGHSTVRTSPARQTPKESIIFTVNPSPEKSHFNERRSREAQERIDLLKRNAKSPSFLKNRQAFKENVQESLSGVSRGEYNQHSPQKQHQASKTDLFKGAPNKLEELKSYDPSRSLSRRKSKTFTLQFSEGDSCLSIECRLRQLLYDSQAGRGE